MKMKLSNKKHLGLLFLSLIVLGGCNIINPAEQIPAYIELKPFQLENTPGLDQGSLSEKITNGYVFINGAFIGIYSLPSTVPVLAEGEVEVVIDPMVRRNGVSSFLTFYPAYERFSTVVELAAGEITAVQPISRYDARVKFLFIEDFETGSPIFSDDRDQNADTKMDTTSSVVFEGSRSGVIRLDRDNPFIEVATRGDITYDLLSADRIFLEVDYKSEVDALFGLIGIDGAGQQIPSYEFGILPKDEWTKIYFDLTEQVILSRFDEYQVGIAAGLPLENGDFAIEEGFIYLDNIKLLTF